MLFDKVVNQRYSIRQFQSKEVPEDIIKKVIKLAQLAPSAGNLQSYQVFITKEKITYIDAPIYFVICADPEKSASRYGDRGKNLYAIQDATIFGAYLQLALVDAGLASVWIGSFREGRLMRQLNIPNSLKPIAIIAAGYSNVEKSSRRRRSFEEIAVSR